MNPIEIGLSFLEGLALIASPCILPVLPLVLSASAEGGRKRPFGIITGFVLSFTAFALLSRKLVLALGIDLDVIKYGSLALLAIFGVILLSEKLSSVFSGLTQRAANAGSVAHTGGGYGSGILIGLLIGLVWTPCAGPILAAILVQIIRQQSDVLAVLLVGSFALGAGIPMLIIALTGRKIMSKLGFFTTHAEGVRKTFGVIILCAVAFIASGIDITSLSGPHEAAATASSKGLQDPLAEPYPAPEFTGLEGWLNSAPLTMQDLRGKVVLVDFWTYSCINCLRTLPYITRWDEQYRDKGLVVIGVHAPEFEFEKSRTNIAAALAKFGIRYPVALDNKLDTWTAFKNRYWPAHYLIDRQGRVVYTHFGEGHYTETENNIRYLLGLDAKAETATDAVTSGEGQSPETYLGYGRASHFASPGGLTRNELQTYAWPVNPIELHHWALAGDWDVTPQRITAVKAGAALRFRFQARHVFLVLGTKDARPVTFAVSLDGKPVGEHGGKDVRDSHVTVSAHRLYDLVDLGKAGEGLLEITAQSPDLEAYAFTFGD